MTLAERNNKLKHFITCLKCEVSGKCCDDNCSVQYDAGNMGEIIENLEAISKALEQEPILDKIRTEIDRARFIDKDTRHYRNALASGLEVALDIIDKYRTESEE